MSISHFSRIFTEANGELSCNYTTHNFATSKCDQIEEFISQGLDNLWVRPGSTIGLTVVPNEFDTTTSVEINDVPIAPDLFEMRVRHIRELGGETHLDLGLWSSGEGRRSIRQVLWNTMAAKLDPRDLDKDLDKMYTRCPNPAHGLAEEKALRAKLDEATSYKTVCLFHIVFEKMCTECMLPFTSDKDWGIPAEAENWNA